MARGATRAHARPRLDSSARDRSASKRLHTGGNEPGGRRKLLPESSVPACRYFSLSVSPRAQSVRRPAPTDTLARPSRRDHAYALTRLTHALSSFTRAAPAVPRCLGKINTTSGLREGFSNSNSADMSSVAAPRKPLAELAEREFLEDLVRLPTISARGARSRALRAIARARTPALILFFACQHRTGKQSARGRRVSNRTTKTREARNMMCFSRESRATIAKSRLRAIATARRSLFRLGHVARVRAAAAARSSPPSSPRLGTRRGNRR